MFASRILGTARSLGLPVRQIRVLNDLGQAVQKDPPACVMVDLHFPALDIAQVVQSLKSLVPAPRIIGFGSHVDTATLKGARAAGCDLVLPRSQFAEDLEQALPRWCGPIITAPASSPPEC